MSDEDDVSVYEGIALPLHESHQVANAFPTRVVLMMGEKDAGKTTLLAEVHHAFLTAPYAGFLFAGSRTLIGFERLCYLARLASGQALEDTERTKYADIRLFHLALARAAAPDQRTHLLLTDVSGERFKEIRSSIDEARELAPLVRRADHIALLVDGDRLTAPKTQMATETNACLLLRGLLEAGGLTAGSSLDVIVSKWDYVVARNSTDCIDRLRNAVRNAASTLTPRYHQIATRITHAVDLAPGHGMETLIQRWMSPTEDRDPSLVDQGSRLRGRWYSRYLHPSRAS